MQRLRMIRTAVMAILGTALVTFSLVPDVPAQGESPKSMRISAVAQGTSTQLGKIVNVDIIIREYSTDEERAALLGAFQAKGSTGLARALNKMSGKGRIAITGTLGYDLNYIRLVDTPTGKKIRFVTDRAITFREAYYDTRSRDYDLSAGEIDLGTGDGKATGVLFPACQFSLDKNNQLEIELRRNAWKLVNIQIHE